MYVYLWVVSSRIQLDYLKQERNSHQRNKLDTKELSCKGLRAEHLWGSGDRRQWAASLGITVFRKHVESLGQHAAQPLSRERASDWLVTCLRGQDLHQQSLDCLRVNKGSFLKGEPEWPVRRDAILYVQTITCYLLPGEVSQSSWENWDQEYISSIFQMSSILEIKHWKLKIKTIFFWLVERSLILVKQEAMMEFHLLSLFLGKVVPVVSGIPRQQF